MILSTLYFIYVLFGLGLAADFFVKWKANFYEKAALRLGVGLALFTVLGVFMDLLFIPLHYLVFGTVATILYGYHIVKKEPLGSFSIKKKEAAYLLIVLALFVITAVMYIGGSFSYTYMENGDPWGYTAVSKVISEELTFKAPYKYHHYAEPYTQGYQILMGVLHQTNDSIYTNMKFFHNLIISFGILFFFFFAKELFKKRDDPETLALLATIVFFAIPSWLSHFIFSLSLNMTLIPVLFYAVLKIDEDKRWQWVATILFASILINHFFTSVIIAIMLFMYFFLKTIIEKKPHKETFTVILAGFAASLAFLIPTNIRHSSFLFDPIRQSHGGLEKILVPLINKPILILLLLLFLALASYFIYYNHSWTKYLKKPKTIYLTALGSSVLVLLLPLELLVVKGSADRIYTFKDFFIASAQNMINNPVGWGYVISVLVVISIFLLLTNFSKLFEKKNFDYLLILTFFVTFFLLTHGKLLSISIMPFRMWTFMALFVSLLAAVAIYAIYKQIPNKPTGIAIVVIILGLLLFSSFIPKYELNNMAWPDEQLMIPELHQFYNQVREDIPSGTVMMNACRNSDYLTSYDMKPIMVDKNFNREYRKDEDLTLFYERFYNLTPEEMHRTLSEYEVEYVSLGISCVIRDIRYQRVDQQTALEELNTKMQEISASSDFQLVSQNNVELLFKVR